MCESTTVEEMSSMEVLQPQNGALESLDASDYSIIPDQVSINSENEPVNGNFNFPNLHSVLMAASPDMSLEELKSHLEDVVGDNISLRAILEQNNQLIQQQLTSTLEWHNHITTKMAQLQLSLREAEEKIVELEKENEKLLTDIKEMKEKPKITVDSQTSMKDNISPLSDEEVDFEIINRKELKNRVDERKLKEADIKIADLTKIIEEQNKQIEALKKQSEDETKPKTLQVEQEKEKSIILANNAIQQLEDKIKTLENSLNMKCAELEEEQICHSETKKMFNIVQTNYDRVTKLLQIQSKDEREKNVDVEREMDTRMYLEQIDNVTAKLLETEEKLQEQDRKVESLVTELNTVKEDAESIPILKAQVEVYKIDLDSITLARDAAMEEVSRLTKQLHDTSSVSLCDSCGGNISMIEGSSKGKGKKPARTPKKPELKQKDDMYVCPVCKVNFTSLQAVENHVNDCIDKSERS